MRHWRRVREGFAGQVRRASVAGQQARPLGQSAIHYAAEDQRPELARRSAPPVPRSTCPEARRGLSRYYERREIGRYRLQLRGDRSVRDLRDREDAASNARHPPKQLLPCVAPISRLKYVE